ncbi:MAG: hypothetical protein ACREMX_04935 [Gemmatimonadales bacterium]
MRVLRVLVEAPRALSVAEIARLAGLNERGIRTVIAALEELGAVEPVVAPHRIVTLRKAWPLEPAVRQLFHAERSRMESILKALSKAAAGLRPHPIGVWLYGSVAAGKDEPGDPIRLAVLADERSASELAQQLDRALVPAARDQGLTIDTRTLTRSDLALAEHGRPDGRDPALQPPLLLLAGVLPPLPGLHRGERNARVHDQRDADARAVGTAIASFIRRDPSLIRRALDAIEIRWELAPPTLRRTLDEWRRLLQTQSPASLARLLAEPGERMTRLRQTLPFLDVLTADERVQFDRVLERTLRQSRSSPSPERAPGRRR